MKLYPLPGGMGGSSGRTCKNCPTLLGGNSICPACKTFNGDGNFGGVGKVTKSSVVALDKVTAASIARIVTGQLWDHVWGGGIVPSTVTLMGGSPGTGKSTIMLQIASSIATVTDKYAYYLSAEQPAEEIKITVERLNLPNLDRILVIKEFGTGSSIDEALLKEFPPAMFIVDSITAMTRDRIAQADIAREYKKLSVKYLAPSVIIVHMSKEGDFAGLLQMQHDVDTLVAVGSVLADPMDEATFMAAGYGPDVNAEDVRLMLSFKNRYGPTNKAFYFRMSEGGLVPLPPPPEKKGGGFGLMTRKPDDEEDDPSSEGETTSRPAPRVTPSEVERREVEIEQEGKRVKQKLTRLPRQEAVEGEALKKKRPAMPRAKKPEKEGKVAKSKKSGHKK